MFPDFFVLSSQQKKLLRAQTLLLMVSCKYHDKYFVLLLTVKVLLWVCTFRILTVGMGNVYTLKDISGYGISVELQLNEYCVHCTFSSSAESGFSNMAFVLSENTRCSS